MVCDHRAFMECGFRRQVDALDSNISGIPLAVKQSDESYKFKLGVVNHFIMMSILVDIQLK